jgi:predicted MFS family arabinose efflux permease
VAPFAGGWADRGLARPVTGIALAAAALAFVVAGLGGRSVVLLALAAILVDVAVQTTLILGQHTVYALDPAARSRLNSVFIAMFFTGGAISTQLGTAVFDTAGWRGLTVLGAAVPLLTLAYWATERRTRPGTPAPV